MGKDKYVTFESWFLAEEMGKGDELEVLESCWNQAIRTASEFFKNEEGTDYGLLYKFLREERD